MVRVRVIYEIVFTDNNGRTCLSNSGLCTFFLYPAHSLVKKPYVLTRASFDFHPFEIRFERWVYLRVRVTKVNKIKKLFHRFRIVQPYSHNHNPQRQRPHGFELKWVKTEGDMDQTLYFFN